MQEVATNKHNFRQARCIQPENEVYCENIVSKEGTGTHMSVKSQNNFIFVLMGKINKSKKY